MKLRDGLYRTTAVCKHQHIQILRPLLLKDKHSMMQNEISFLNKKRFIMAEHSRYA